jgi:hypothetical protein
MLFHSNLLLSSLILWLNFACKATRTDLPSSSALMEADGADAIDSQESALAADRLSGAFPNARAEIYQGEKTLLLTSDNYPKVRKSVSILSSCVNIIEAKDRENALVRVILSGPDSTAARNAYSKLWIRLIQVQELLLGAFNTSRLERRFSRMDVCINSQLPAGSARYQALKVEIPSPYVNEEQLLHELGHLVMAQVLGPQNLAAILDKSPTRCNPHSPSIKVDQSCAFLEGWGHYIAMVLKNSPILFNVDYSQKGSSFPVDQNEQLTARILWILGKEVGLTDMLEALYGTQDNGSCYPRNLGEFVGSLESRLFVFKRKSVRHIIDQEFPNGVSQVCSNSAVAE